MNFQAYTDSIKAKTGKTPEDFRSLADKKGLLNPLAKAGEVIDWLKNDYDLGHGHSMYIYSVLKSEFEPQLNKEESIDKHFSGKKSSWKPVFDNLMLKLSEYGDITIDPRASYLSLLRDGKKFAVIQITNERMDIGIKLKGSETTERFEEAGSWNAMMTHRVKINNPEQVDHELITWLNNAYEQAIKQKVKN